MEWNALCNNKQFRLYHATLSSHELLVMRLSHDLCLLQLGMSDIISEINSFCIFDSVSCKLGCTAIWDSVFNAYYTAYFGRYSRLSSYSAYRKHKIHWNSTNLVYYLGRPAWVELKRSPSSTSSHYLSVSIALALFLTHSLLDSHQLHKSFTPLKMPEMHWSLQNTVSPSK